MYRSSATIAAGQVVARPNAPIVSGIVTAKSTAAIGAVIHNGQRQRDATGRCAAALRRRISDRQNASSGSAQHRTIVSRLKNPKFPVPMIRHWNSTSSQNASPRTRRGAKIMSGTINSAEKTTPQENFWKPIGSWKKYQAV